MSLAALAAGRLVWPHARAEAPYPECGVSELEGDAALGCEAPPPGCA